MSNPNPDAEHFTRNSEARSPRDRSAVREVRRDLERLALAGAGRGPLGAAEAAARLPVDFTAATLRGAADLTPFTRREKRNNYIPVVDDTKEFPANIPQETFDRIIDICREYACIDEEEMKQKKEGNLSKRKEKSMEQRKADIDAEVVRLIAPYKSEPEPNAQGRRCASEPLL